MVRHRRDTGPATASIGGGIDASAIKSRQPALTKPICELALPLDRAMRRVLTTPRLMVGFPVQLGPVVEMVDTAALGAAACKHVGSNPAGATIQIAIPRITVKALADWG